MLSHWKWFYNYYNIAYTNFLIKMKQKADDDEIVDITSENEIKKISSNIGTILSNYQNTNEVNSELTTYWKELINLYKNEREKLRQLNSLTFDACEERFVFQQKYLGLFYARHKSLMIKHFWEDLDELKINYDEFVDKFYAKSVEINSENVSIDLKNQWDTMLLELQQSENVINMRMDVLVNNQDVLYAYRIIQIRIDLVNNGVDKLRAAKDLEPRLQELQTFISELFILYNIEDTIKGTIDWRNKINSILNEIRNKAITITPTIIFNNEENQLVFDDDTRRVIISIDLLKRYHFVTMQQTSKKDLKENEYITSNALLIPSIKSNVDLFKFYQNDVKTLLLSSNYEGSPFDRFRIDHSNCEVRLVKIKGEDIGVLIATSNITANEILIRGYDDTELYKLWMENHDKQVGHLRAMSPLRIKTREHTNKLEETILTLKRKKDIIDLQIRLHLLDSFAAT